MVASFEHAITPFVVLSVCVCFLHRKFGSRFGNRIVNAIFEVIALVYLDIRCGKVNRYCQYDIGR